MASIEYFYAAHSAFAYLGSARLMAIAKAAGRTLDHRPVDLTAVIAGANHSATSTRTDAHRAYFFGREISRWSEERSAPVMDGMPTHHRNDITLPNCTLIAGVLAGLNIDNLSHAFLEGHWKDNADLADAPTLAALARAAGYDPEPLLESAQSEAVQAQYAANTAEAIERSVFGSPTYFVDGDMFYGQDRLEMVERTLKQPYR